jgi:pimeloyl-ACP methyl ester carboxylesterase
MQGSYKKTTPVIPVNILFIRGYNTDNILENDTYSNIWSVLSEKNKVTYLNYSVIEDMNIVYERLCKQIQKTKYTHLIGHSMGGGLLMKYIQEHNVVKYTKIILLMPLIYKDPLISMVAKVPFIEYLYLPKVSFLPASKLTTQGNILNDDYSYKPLHQIMQMYNQIMLEPNNIIETLNRNKKNTILFYAKKEAFNTIPEEILQQIKNIEYVDGYHECFNDLYTSRSFYHSFLPYI